jgi:Glycosyl hydrolase catalytic core
MLRTCLILLALTACAGDAPDAGPGRGRASSAARGSALYGLNVPADGGGSATVSDLGASWVRLELVDGSTGAALAPHVAQQLSATLDDYHARGVSVLLLVDYSSRGGNAGFGAGQGACGDWDGYRAAWLGRLGHVAAQFGERVDAWEIWNEPDQPLLACGDDGYNPGIPAAEYGTLLRDAYQTIRNAGASAPIVTGGLDSGNVQYIVEGANAAGGLWADGVSIHPYGVVPDTSWCPNPGEDLNCDWGTLGGKVDEYTAWTGLPVWITEWGIKTTDTRHAAAYLADGYAAFASRGDLVAHAFWFCESDAMVAPFGLTFADGTPKPDVYATYQALTGGDPGGGGGGDPGGGPGVHTSQLHGTVEAGGSGIEGLWVSAWGKTSGDFHVAFTDALGIYQFTALDPDSGYNLVVNAQFDPSVPGGFAVIDEAHAYDVRNDVELVSGPDGWHGENFQLPF